MRLSSALNKLKMNKNKQGVISLEKSKQLIFVLSILQEKKYIQEYVVDDAINQVHVNLYKNNIRIIKGYSTKLTYSKKELEKKVYSELTKFSGIFIISCNKSPYLIDHHTAIEKNIGGIIVGYVE